MKCILYARVSTDSQRDNNVSLPDQLKAMRRYAQERGWHIYSEVQESASGYDYDRDYLDGVREEAKKGTFQILLVYRTDRFARDEAVFLLLERYFKKHNIRLFSVEDGEFTPGVINRYLAAINRAKAQDEADTFKRRSKEARLAYAHAGVPPGQSQAVYGYRKEGKKRETRYVINKEEAAHIRQIFDMFVRQGLSCMEIAVQFTDMKIPSPAISRGIKRGYSGRWQNTTVRKILGNTAYIGRLIIYRQKVVDGKQIMANKDENVTIPIPAIIDEKTFKQAQHLLSFKDNLKERRKHPYYLTGMVKCSCGFAMSGATTNGNNRNGTPRARPTYLYRCGAYNKSQGRGKCGNRSLNALDLEATVWDFVERLIKDPATTLALYQKDQEAKDALLTHVQERIAAIDELLDENTGELRRLQRMYQRGGCDDQYFDAEKKRIDDERGAFNKERGKAQALLDRNKNAIAQLAELEEIGEEVRYNLLGITDEKKKRIYQRLRLHITAEPCTAERDPRPRHVVIEVLGYAERVRVKSVVAPSQEFFSTALPLVFRVPLSHA